MLFGKLFTNPKMWVNGNANEITMGGVYTCKDVQNVPTGDGALLVFKTENTVKQVFVPVGEEGVVYTRVLGEDWSSVSGTSEETEALIQSAIDKANQAQAKADTVNTRLNNIIVESGTSDAEVVAARTDSEGQTFTTLGVRLDTQFRDIKEDLIHNSETLNTEDGFSTYPITRKARLNTDGSVVPSTAFVTTDFIPLKNGTYKIIRENFTGDFTVYRCTYDPQKKLIEYTTFVQNTAEREYVVPSTNVAFIRYSVSEVVYNGGISFKLVENLKDDVNSLRRNVYGNLCGDNPNEFYPVVLNEGDYITLSTSTGDAPPSPTELIFFDANYYRIGAYTLNAKRRSIKIDKTYAATKYIKWGKKPDVPMQVELGGSCTEYKEYRPNIFTCAQLLDESKNVYTYAPLPIVAVMSYNVGEWYDGTRHEMPESEYSLYENIQKTILRKNYASIFCAQEYYHTMYTKALDAKNMFLYPLYKHVSTLDDVALSRGKAIATNLWIESVESVDFVNQSGIASKYQKAYLFINGHKVCVCNVHLSNIDTQQALLEAQEIATAMANEEYFIVMGDFNVSFATATGADVISAFEAIGAKPCNYGAFGQFDTYRGSTSIGTTDIPLDNIFVSSNITIKSVYIDTTKIDAELPIQDHVPLVAYLEIF